MHGVTREITLRVELLGTPESAAKNQTTRWRVTTAPIKRSAVWISLEQER